MIQSICGYKNTKIEVKHPNNPIKFGSRIVNSTINEYMQILKNPAKALSMKNNGIDI